MGSRVVTPENVVDSFAAFPTLLRAGAGSGVTSGGVRIVLVSHGIAS